MSVLGGVEFSNHLTLNANYGFGLVNIAKDIDEAPLKNKVFTISVGYLF